MRKTILAVSLAACLALPTSHAQEGGGGVLLLWGMAVLAGENLASTVVVQSVAEEYGYPADFLPMFGYGIIGIASTFYLASPRSLWLPLVMGSLAGNAYCLYRTHSNRELTLSLGTKSLGLGPEGFSPGISVGFRDFRLGMFRGDMGDQSYPGPNVAGNGSSSVDRYTSSVHSLEAEYRKRVFRNLRWLAGAGRTWSNYYYQEFSGNIQLGYWDRSFANYYLQTGLGYTFFQRFDLDFQLGYMLLRDRYREEFLQRIGSGYTRDEPVQASLKMLLKL